MKYSTSLFIFSALVTTVVAASTPICELPCPVGTDLCPDKCACCRESKLNTVWSQLMMPKITATPCPILCSIGKEPCRTAKTGCTCCRTYLRSPSILWWTYTFLPAIIPTTCHPPCAAFLRPCITSSGNCGCCRMFFICLSFLTSSLIVCLRGLQFNLDLSLYRNSVLYDLWRLRLLSHMRCTMGGSPSDTIK